MFGERLKIALFTDAYHPYVSGVITSIDMIRECLEEKGYDVYVIALRTSLDDNYDDNDYNVIKFEGYKYPFKKLSTYYYTNDLKNKAKLLKKYNFDLVHIHTEFSAGKIGMYYAKYYNVPLVYTFHTNYEDYLDYITTTLKMITHKILLFRIKRMIRFYESKADVVIVPTKKVVDTFKKYNFSFDVTILPTGIDIDKFNKEKLDNNIINDIIIKYKLENKFVFCSIGRISKEKSIDILINAFYKANISDSVLIICGTGPNLDSLKKLVNKLNVEKKIIFTDVINYDLVQYYYAVSDVFLNASTSETQGLTYIEALASSLPIIVKQDKAIDELLINKENGLVFKTEDELIELMKLIVTDKNLFNYMKNKCSDTISKFTKEHYVNSLEKIYLNLIDK